MFAERNAEYRHVKNVLLRWTNVEQVRSSHVAVEADAEQHQHPMHNVSAQPKPLVTLSRLLLSELFSCAVIDICSEASSPRSSWPGRFVSHWQWRLLCAAMLRLPPWAVRAGAGLVVVTGAALWFGRKRLSRAISTLWYGDVEMTHALAVLDTVDHNLQQLRSDLQAAVAERPPTAAGSDTGLTGRGASGYYHFSSDGVKLPSKWDTFDVDAELAKVEGEPAATRKPTPSSPKPVLGETQGHTGVAVSKRIMLIQQLALDAERLLRDMDAVLVAGPGAEEATMPSDWVFAKRRKRRLIDSVHALLRGADAAEAQLRAAQ